MNGSTDVRAGSTSSPASAAGRKIDTPLPLDRPVTETARSGASGIVKGRPGERMISGIDLIDYGVGGLMPNKVYVVKGGIGVGKTIVGLQFLTRGLEHQEPGILVTDQRPENVIAQAKTIGFPIEDAVRRNQLAILNPSQRYFDLVESPADVMAIVEELADYVKKVGARRLVIDPVYTLINTSYSSHFALTITQSLLNALEDLPVTTLLVSGDDESNAELNPIVRMLEQNSFGVVHLSQDASTGGRLMRLSKLRYANSEHLAAHYRILDGRGLINYRGEGERVQDVTKPWEETGTTSRAVLILGAQPDTIRRVKESLGSEFDVQSESDLKAGVERVKRDKPGLVLVTPSRAVGAVSAILDLAQNTSSSIAFLSPASNRQSDKVLYLRAGADDFITEPFTPAELRARVDALIRRSGRRLNIRDTGIGTITPEEMSSLMNTGTDNEPARRGPAIQSSGDGLSFDPEFNDRLQRNVDTVSKFDQPFALYWIKATDDDRDLNKSLAQLCRQEDIVCHNRNGEFVAILTGTDENGIKGFENRLEDKLGAKLSPNNVRRGYSLHKPGDPTEGFPQRAFARR
jgi:KaiC/GvpD/RAD55 family RecA-like ATPase/DNA-binding response OmpR family regulator